MFTTAADAIIRANTAAASTDSDSDAPGFDLDADTESPPWLHVGPPEV